MAIKKRFPYKAAFVACNGGRVSVRLRRLRAVRERVQI